MKRRKLLVLWDFAIFFVNALQTQAFVHTLPKRPKFWSILG
jgi:hypothetical protein